MILSLRIKNFILIDDLTIEFSKGVNVLTGETGAGKSIIINAIDVVLGSKTNKDCIKTGQDKAIIEIIVDLPDSFDFTVFDSNGIDLDNNQVVISREVTATTSRSRINGVLVTQDFIKEIRELLLDIHTQHQNYNYIQQKNHIKLLDNFGTNSYKNLLLDFQNLYSNYIKLQKKLQEVTSLTNSTEQQIDFLKFQIEEIESAQIEEADEDSKLDKELNVLLNAEKLKDLSFASYWELYGADNNVISALGAVNSNLTKLAQLDESTVENQDELVNCIEILKDLASGLRNYSEAQEPNNARIDEIQDRINLLDKLKRKYGGNLESVLRQWEHLKHEFQNIEYSRDKMTELENELKEIQTSMQVKANELSVERRQLASQLSNLIVNELEKLELPKVQFLIDVSESSICENGADKVEFLISTNISESLKPLAKVASGGEISRVMLAIKTVFAQADSTNTVIFDEIDTGISGKASQSVSDAIVNLSKHHQIILITHQPIIAAKAHCHLYVTKSQDEETKVKVYNLQGENRTKAIALLAGGEVTDESMNFARGLIS